MTWIKPSFGWMLHRSGYASKPGQERILKIKVSRAGFGAILSEAVLSTFHPQIHGSRDAWKRAVDRGQVRCQWDPDRDLRLNRLDRRAIQLGLQGSFSRRYVEEWIVALEDATPLARAVFDAVRSGAPLPAVPEERLYAATPQVRSTLGM
jgi:hypothetical protein